MNTVFKLSLLLFVSILWNACKNPKTAETAKNPRKDIYRASVPVLNDLIHTELRLEPDFEKRELKGTATLTFRPHFYPVSTININAKNMRIQSVDMQYTSVVVGAVEKDEQIILMPLKYSYDSMILKIVLDRDFTKEETYSIQIKYVAQPELNKSEGNDAITDTKGIYFINHDGSDSSKPTQIWTQGETEEASCWFPTLDAPNQKTTQELYVTVPDKYKTISNGRLVSSTKVDGNKRTDYWKQDLPHAPYLFALVVGDFSETKDKWRDKPVNYYLEHSHAEFAKLIFGNTPEMMEFYSTKLGYDYPWDKLHQVVVRDFVSGAMENTGCVIHFEKLQHNSREHLDNTYEDIIAHELFHHWFGDLVTCESWSNLPLNESFANYGEYLWYEHKYGRDEADFKLRNMHGDYFNEAQYKQESLIRYDYEDEGDMFDAHSYEKGGSVMHMLRKYTGDEAFYKALNLYLKTNAFKTVELSDLRKAFETVTGEDLNWFFNQWFFNIGHPTIKVFHQTYNGSGERYGITVVREGNFKMPIDVDLYSDSGVRRIRLTIEKDSQTFAIPSAFQPLCVIFDAENQLLANIEETKTIAGWEAQLKYAPLAAQKIMAYNQLLNIQADNGKNLEYSMQMLKDNFWLCRSAAVGKIRSLKPLASELKTFTDIIRKLADNDPKSAVRKETVVFFKETKDKPQLEKMLEDSSYDVVKAALMALNQVDRAAAYSYADKHRFDRDEALQERIFVIIGNNSKENELDFFISKIQKGPVKTANSAATGLSYYMINQPDKVNDVLSRLEKMAEDKNSNSGKNALSALTTIRSFYSYQVYYYQIFSKSVKKNKKEYKLKEEQVKEIYQRLNAIVTRLG